jgi:hypothetical protein
VPVDDAALRARTRRVWLARAIALGADFVQIVALPVFLPGALSPWDDALDVVVGLVLVRLVGWHWAFLPAFVGELIPGFELFPTWTMAVLFVTRGKLHAKDH